MPRDDDAEGSGGEGGDGCGLTEGCKQRQVRVRA